LKQLKLFHPLKWWDYRLGFGLVIRFIDHLHTHDSWLHFTDHWHTQTRVLSLLVYTKRFLETDFKTRTITVSLKYTLQLSHTKSSLHSRDLNWALLQIILFFTASSTELPYNWLCPLLITSRHGPRRDIPFLTATVLLCAYSLPREHVSRAFAQKRPLFTESSLSNGSMRHNILGWFVKWRVTSDIIHYVWAIDSHSTNCSTFISHPIIDYSPVIRSVVK
jgi:hypothetical protein